MHLYLAPMEEITGYIFRNVTDRHFSGADRFVTPFISPNQKNILKTKDGREIVPEHNEGKDVAVQILTNQSEGCLELISYLKTLGYNRINLNFGCPSGTVIKKFRGSGILKDVEMLDRLLGELFDSSITDNVEISVKTRVGMDSEDNWPSIIDVYNRYSIEELTVHPRIGADLYRGKPRMNTWEYALEHYKGKLCYNGDVVSAKQVDELKQKYRQESFDGVMIGRGAVSNPGIFREIRTGQRTTVQELKAWHDDLFAEYEHEFSSSDAMYKMKEVWFYLGKAFEDVDRALKSVRKSNNKADYFAAVREIWHHEYCGVDEMQTWQKL